MNEAVEFYAEFSDVEALSAEFESTDEIEGVNEAAEFYAEFSDAEALSAEFESTDKIEGIIDVKTTTVYRNDHNALINRTADNRHPIKAITRLRETLDELETNPLGTIEIDNIFSLMR